MNLTVEIDVSVMLTGGFSALVSISTVSLTDIVWTWRI